MRQDNHGFLARVKKESLSLQPEPSVISAAVPLKPNSLAKLDQTSMACQRSFGTLSKACSVVACRIYTR